MSLEPTIVLIYAGGAIVTLFLLLSMAAIATSVRERRRDRKRVAARERVRSSLFGRAAQDEPDWESWIADLSATERTQVADIIEHYLRTLRGSGQESFLAVARAMDMGAAADEHLDDSSILNRLRALARLTVLDYPIDEQRLLATSLEHRRTREAAARLLYERREEFANPEALGTALLLWDGQQSMGIRGLETLHDLNSTDPFALFSQGFWGVHRWRPTVLVQVCTVLQACRIRRVGPIHEWVFTLFDHWNPRLRAAAIRAVKSAGHRDDVRSRIPFTQLITDEDPRVRRSTYQVLAAWGDTRAKGLLEWAVIDEEDERAQLVAIRALASLESEPDAEQPGWPDAAWDWVRAERAVYGTRPLTTQGVKT